MNFFNDMRCKKSKGNHMKALSMLLSTPFVLQWTGHWAWKLKVCRNIAIITTLPTSSCKPPSLQWTCRVWKDEHLKPVFQISLKLPEVNQTVHTFNHLKSTSLNMSGLKSKEKTFCRIFCRTTWLVLTLKFQILRSIS